MKYQPGKGRRAYLHGGIDRVLLEVDGGVSCFQPQIKIGIAGAKLLQIRQGCKCCECGRHAHANNLIALPHVEMVACTKQFIERTEYRGSVNRAAHGKYNVAAAALNQLNAEMSSKVRI